jgi:hypothetical protein
MYKGLGFGIGGCYPLSAAKSAEEGGGESVADKNFDVGLNLFFQVWEGGGGVMQRKEYFDSLEKVLLSANFKSINLKSTLI